MNIRAYIVLHKCRHKLTYSHASVCSLHKHIFTLTFYKLTNTGIHSYTCSHTHSHPRRDVTHKYTHCTSISKSTHSYYIPDYTRLRLCTRNLHLPIYTLLRPLMLYASYTYIRIYVTTCVCTLHKNTLAYIMIHAYLY